MTTTNLTKAVAKKIDHVIFGVGHFYYPNSRFSLGSRIVDRLADYYKLRWQFREKMFAWVAEGDKFVLVKPRTAHVKFNYKAVQAALRTYYTADPIRDLTIIHHDVTKSIGEYLVTSEPIIEDTVRMEFRELHMLHDHTTLDGYRRVAIGIKPLQNELYQTAFSSILKTDDSDMRVNFLYNKLPATHEKFLTEKLFKNMDAFANAVVNKSNGSPQLDFETKYLEEAEEKEYYQKRSRNYQKQTRPILHNVRT